MDRCVMCLVAPPTGKGKRYCAACDKICRRCKSRPRMGKRAYCRECNRDYDRQYVRNRSPELWMRDKIRKAVNQDIRLKRRERQPCLICENPNSLVLVTDVKNKQVVFACKAHHQQVAEFYGRVLAEIRRDRSKQRGNLSHWQHRLEQQILQSGEEGAEKPLQTADSPQ